MIKLIKLLESFKQLLLARAKDKQAKVLDAAASDIDKAYDKANDCLDALYRFCNKVERMAIDTMKAKHAKANAKKAASAAKLDELNKL